jgi:hypothetical protein
MRKNNMYLFVMTFVVLSAVMGAVQRTFEGAWHLLTPVGYATYFFSFLTFVCLMSTRMLTRPLVTKKTSSIISEPKKDAYGFWDTLSWGIVAELEHELGYVHSEQSAKACRSNSHWVADQQPVYLMENGFLTIESFPELPESLRPSTHRLAKDADGRPVANLRELAKITPTENLNAVRERTNQVLLDSLLAGGGWLDVQAEKDGVDPDEVLFEDAIKAFDSYINLEPDMDIVEPSYKTKMSKQSADFHRVLDSIMESFQNPNQQPMVLPKGYTITYRQGGEIMQINAPNGTDCVVLDNNHPMYNGIMTPNEARARGYSRGQPVSEMEFTTSLDGVGRGLDKGRRRDESQQLKFRARP